MELTKEHVFKQLATVIDPETGLDLVSMGLFYAVKVDAPKIFIRMTLTSPGCPLIDMFDDMIRDALSVFEETDQYEDVTIELTFDPPWVPDMMSEEAKAELGID
jgi:metal-sulfur cluster biosynthetic enzyme